MATKELDLGNVTGPVGPQGAVGPQGQQGIQGVPGKDATVNGYNVATLTASGNVELEQSEGAMTVKTTEAVDNAVKWACNRNLLDNWYFVGGGSQKGDGSFPINQKGQTEYTGVAYGIDRWKAQYATVKIEQGYVSFLKDQWANMEQIIDSAARFGNLTMTASAICCGDAKLIIGLNGDFSNQVAIKSDDFQLYTKTFKTPAEMSSFTFIFQSDNNEVPLKIIAAKLELGPVQTLAHKEGDEWVLNEVPDYATELLKCMRYQWITCVEQPLWLAKNHDGPSRMTLVFPVEMRAIPAVKYTTYVGDTEATVSIDGNTATKQSVSFYSTDMTGFVGVKNIILDANL